MATVRISISIFSGQDPHGGRVLLKTKSNNNLDRTTKNLIIQNAIAFFMMETITVTGNGLRYHLVWLNITSRTSNVTVFNKMNNEHNIRSKWNMTHTCHFNSFLSSSFDGAMSFIIYKCNSFRYTIHECRAEWSKFSSISHSINWILANMWTVIIENGSHAWVELKTWHRIASQACYQFYVLNAFVKSIRPIFKSFHKLKIKHLNWLKR